ncbi:MAG: CapA family protein [Treponema sp.]|nr:CapA family protein [Treponema sp.]MCL2237577.1 CapA family protein [Treponema sp.]
MKNKIFLTLFVLIFLSCPSKPEIPDENIETEQAAANTHTITFAAVGDNLFHVSLIRSAQMADGTYDFSSLYTEIKPIIQKADLAFINQETVMAGTSFGYSGYPTFNSPQILAHNLVDAGFDIMNLANNHAMDMGRNGLYATLDFIDTIPELTVIGARKSGESARIISKNNITLGFLSYTFSLNGIALPSDNPNLVSMIDRPVMTSEMNALRPLCDFLIVSIHWGAEYLLEPDNFQRDMARFIAEHDVDLIIGHHPHVLQRMEMINLPDGRKTLCYFSLGNFASHQRERERIIGGMIVLTFTKTVGQDSTGQEHTVLSIDDAGMLPVITHYDRRFENTKIYPFYSYTQETMNDHGLLNFERGLSFEFFFGVLNRLNTKIYMHNPLQ